MRDHLPPDESENLHQSFDERPLAKYDRPKDRGFIEKSPVGLDRYVEGFDPDAPEPEWPKFLGIF